MKRVTAIQSQMLSEARARLANTKGKKAKRKVISNEFICLYYV